MLKELATVILQMLLSQPVFHEDVGVPAAKQHQLELLAPAIATAVTNQKGWPGTPLELARLELAVLRYEAGASLRIQAGDCHAYECDHGRAHGLWQQHVTRFLPQGVWERLSGVDEASTNLSAQEAANALVRARRMCLSLERPGADWVTMTLASYGGRGCTGWYRGIDLRKAEYVRLQRFH